MKKRSWSNIKSWFLLGLYLLPFLVAIHFLNENIAQQRQDYHLKPSPLKPSLDVPSFVGTVLLGGFRAVAIDFLWVRATTLQRLGEWWELNTLFELIAYLQPNQVEVWAFNAWNLAYNISVDEVYPGEQWLWIKKGIDFLEEGIQKNEHSYYLPWYMAVIYSHKIPQNAYFEKASPDRFKKAIEYCKKSLKQLENPREWFQSLMTLKNSYNKQALEYERLGEFSKAKETWDQVIHTRKWMAEVNPHFKIDPTEIQYWEDWKAGLLLQEKGDLAGTIKHYQQMLYGMLDNRLEIAYKLFYLQDEEVFRLQKEGQFEEAEQKIRQALLFWQEHHLRAIEFDMGIGFPRLEEFVTLWNQAQMVNQLWRANQIELAKSILKTTLERIDESLDFNAPESMEQRFLYFGGRTTLENQIVRSYPKEK